MSKLIDYKREWYLKNRERLLEKAKKYQEENRDSIRNRKTKWTKNNKEKVKEYQSKYRENNRKEIKERHKKWVKENKERNLEHKRKWEKNNPDSVYARSGKRRASKKNAVLKGFDKELKKIYTECKEITKKTGIPHEVDHIIPLQHDLVCGLHVPWNLQILTRDKNRSKGNKYE